ncbi:carboxymuconolactone decarboxylase family protein [Rugamonas apoptosis]|uniref:Carboxymuconolactone decarboxylase family protein n=1 Tax=Rugamonas apoptosis TaxID=2758570 RepID=A0A7W2FA85_9BURK|nr:carboxymuconolactone decarboxylase family protein [Rugamonas apoptosis]MBA5688012.1 carboxymuconolactone decarboxylase family protein [Rugamonas apoptosis]
MTTDLTTTSATASATITPRLDYASFSQLAPAAGAALRALGQAVDDSGLDKSLTELLKLRASQLNGCAFCLQYHLNLARALPQPPAPAKLDLLATWRDAHVYTARERAALAWTEALTLMAGHHVDDAVHQELERHFNTAEIAFLTAAVANINAWNRIAGALRFTAPVPAQAMADIHHHAEA